MATAPLRWGLLSTARINRKLIPAIRQAGRAALLAVASRDPDQARAYAAEWEIPRAHASYQALLDDPDVDVVYIPLPNSLHAEWAVRAARAGKHVLCEKPLALSVAECQAIAAAAAAAGVVVMEAFMYLYHPLLRRARELVREGAVGEVTLVRGEFSFVLDRPADVRWQPALGGGALWDIGCYPVSFVHWLAGPPQEAFGWQERADTGVDHTFAGLLRCPDGVLGTVACSFRLPYHTQAEVRGTAGTLVVEQPFAVGPESRIRLLRGESVEEIPAPADEPYRCEVEALTAAVLDGAPLAVPLSASLAHVAALTALYESARQGRPVPVGSS